MHNLYSKHTNNQTQRNPYLPPLLLCASVRVSAWSPFNDKNSLVFRFPSHLPALFSCTSLLLLPLWSSSSEDHTHPDTILGRRKDQIARCSRKDVNLRSFIRRNRISQGDLRSSSKLEKCVVPSMPWMSKDESSEKPCADTKMNGDERKTTEAEKKTTKAHGHISENRNGSEFHDCVAHKAMVEKKMR